MDIIEKAKELGQMIADSEEFANMKKAEAAQTNDEKARQLIKLYNDQRRQAVAKMKNESIDPETMKALQKELQDEFDMLYQNENIKAYIEAKKDFEQLMQSVNSVISFYVTGEEKADCSSGGCGSCGGCK